MAVASTPLPPTFLQCPGEPTMPFGTWLKMFENDLLVIDVEGAKWPDTRVRATLLHSVGTEAQRIFYTLTETGTTYNHAVTALWAHFVPKVNVIAERHKFRQRAQRHDETIAQYVSALREMIVLCAFGNAEQDMLRDQIVEKAYSGRIRERLLLEDKLTLDKAIQTANQVETAVRNVAEFSNSEVPVREIRVPKWEQKLPATSKQRKVYSLNTLKALMVRHCIQHIRTTIYHPEGNGDVERLNRVLKESILTAQRENAPWKAHVAEFLQVYRATPHATPGTSPFQLMYGRKIRTKLSILPQLTDTQDQELRDRVEKKQWHMKTYTDAKRNAKIPKIHPGSLVRVRNPLHVKKGKPKFSEPLKVTQQKGPHSYTLEKPGMLHTCWFFQKHSLLHQKKERMSTGQL
ncbi:uncharacterized protein LOC117542374 [Gymnodraco acuticeps]|uniref:Uncharacterized protein LOC117542374 n=1 Tax=Gymnodraco acuticeps TaxID=8218 RepID=A0A6P8U499_GYMAC|nr:uncharacterized protein LOC117542374 [Gymnodraco acuticeps]